MGTTFRPSPSLAREPPKREPPPTAFHKLPLEERMFDPDVRRFHEELDRYLERRVRPEPKPPVKRRRMGGSLNL